MRFSIVLTILAIVAMGTDGTRQAHADEHGVRQTGYGIFEFYNAEGNWVVIDDQAMSIEQGVKVHDERGSGVSNLADVTAGTAVRYAYHIDKQVWHVSAMRLIDEIPYIVDEDGVPQR